MKVELKQTHIDKLLDLLKRDSKQCALETNQSQFTKILTRLKLKENLEICKILVDTYHFANMKDHKARKYTQVIENLLVEFNDNN